MEVPPVLAFFRRFRELDRLENAETVPDTFSMRPCARCKVGIEHTSVGNCRMLYRA